jgi:NADH:ubiquinone oxidoreductase subunit K
MPRFFPPDRTDITQCLLYDAHNLATVAATNVWMHFSKRVLSHVRMKIALDEEAYGIVIVICVR